MSTSNSNGNSAAYAAAFDLRLADHEIDKREVLDQLKDLEFKIRDSWMNLKGNMAFIAKESIVASMKIKHEFYKQHDMLAESLRLSGFNSSALADIWDQAEEEAVLAQAGNKVTKTEELPDGSTSTGGARSSLSSSTSCSSKQNNCNPY